MKKILTTANGLLLALLALSVSSCGTRKDLVYMQDDSYDRYEEILNLNKVKVQPQDQLSIIVSCKEPQSADLFNLKRSQNSGGSSQNMAYTVDDQGDINFPVLGKLRVAGLTRTEISEYIANRLIKDGQITDPVVLVEFANLHFSALGAINTPGTYPITNDKMTLLEAIATAGDLMPNGERNIIVIREQDGKRIKYTVDLRDKDIFDSPVYYIQQNDVIYVKPDKKIARQAADNPNDWKSIGLWMSIASFVSTMAILIFK